MSRGPCWKNLKNRTEPFWNVFCLLTFFFVVAGKARNFTRLKNFLPTYSFLMWICSRSTRSPPVSETVAQGILSEGMIYYKCHSSVHKCSRLIIPFGKNVSTSSRGIVAVSLENVQYNFNDQLCVGPQKGFLVFGITFFSMNLLFWRPTVKL